MTDRLWTGGEAYGTPDASDGGAAGITTAVTVQLQSAGSIAGVQYRAPNTVSGTWTIGLWEVTSTDDTPAGTLLTSKNVTVVAGVSQDLLFDAPVPITPLTKLYRVGVWSSAGRYVFAAGVFTGVDVTSPGGFIKAYRNGADPVGLGSIRDGSFKDNAAFQYPALGGGGSYGMGPIFEPAGADLNLTSGPGGAIAGSTPQTLTIGVTIADSPGGAIAGATTDTLVNPVDVNLTSGPGGGILGSTVDTAVASAALADAAVMPVLIQVMTCLQAELQKVQNPPLNFHVRPGATFAPNADSQRDECCEGIAWVRPGPMFRSTAFPEQLNEPNAAGTSQWAIQIELGVERCIPVVGTDGNDSMPSAAQWLAATQAAMDDRAALRRTICCVEALLGRRRVLAGAITPLENAGTCGGETVILTINLQACEC